MHGRVALITGVGQPGGIGAAVARRLHEAGARVVVHALPGEPGAGPEDALRIEADLEDPLAPVAIVGAAREAFGHVDVLVANHARSANQTLEELTAEELDSTWAVNARGSLLLAREFAAQHDGRPGGRIVLFTSGQYHGAMAGELPYIASKGAIHQVTKSLAVHLAPRGITVNCLDPGPTDTGYAGPALAEAVRRASPRGRWGLPDDAARIVAWLVSDDADWVSGQVIASDGAWSARPRA